MTIHDRDRSRVRERLLEEGFSTGYVTTLLKDAAELRKAAPVLLDLYEDTESLLAKEDLVLGLSASQFVSTDWLVAELRNLRSEIERDPESTERSDGVPKASASSGATWLGWRFADCLTYRADAGVFDDIVEIVRDPAYGKARQMLPLALTRVRSRRDDAVRALVDVLGDPDFTAHVLDALGKLKAVEAREEIARFVDSSAPLVRSTARKVLRKLDKLEGRSDSEPERKPPDPQVPELPPDASATSTNFDLEQIAPFLERISERVEGLETADIERLVNDLEDMEPDEEATFTFAITYLAERQPLQIRAFMDDEGAPDLELVSSPAVVSMIEEVLDENPPDAAEEGP